MRESMAGQFDLPSRGRVCLHTLYLGNSYLDIWRHFGDGGIISLITNWKRCQVKSYLDITLGTVDVRNILNLDVNNIWSLDVACQT
jgi:hypothetical protein